EFIKEIKAYLEAEPGDDISLPAKMAEKLKNHVAFLRAMIHSFMPMTLNKIYGQDYGFPKNYAFDKGLMALPFKGADNPQLEAQFAHIAAQMGYAIQAYVKYGIPSVLLGP